MTDIQNIKLRLKKGMALTMGEGQELAKYIEELEKTLEHCEVSEHDKDHIWYKGQQYISLRRFLEVKKESFEKGYADGRIYELLVKMIERNRNSVFSANPQEPKTDIRECGLCKYSKDGHMAGTEECHVCMWESKKEPRIGHWIIDAETYYKSINERGNRVDEYTPYFTDDIACSECLAKYSTIDNETEFFKYCPNCGCRMES